MSITSLAIKRPILFIVFYLLLVGLGFFSYKQLKFELLPELATPFVVVATQYPGASPKEVENSVTKKIEDVVAEVSKVKKVTSASSENISIVTLEFLASANADQAAQDVQRAVSKVVSEFGVGIKNPSIEKFNINDLPVLRVGVTSSGSAEDLFELIKNQIKPSLSQIKSVGRVTLMGGAEKEIKIWIDNAQLLRYRLSLPEVLDVIQKANQDVPLGKVKDGDAQFSIRLAGKVNDFDELLNQDIKIFGDGSKIKVRDVATIILDKKETLVVNRLDLKPSIGLFIGKRVGSNAVEVSESVRKQFENLENEYASINLKFEIAQDTSEFTLKAAEHVFEDFLIALILVALVMLVFLHSIRNAAIVMLAIPTSLASAFIMMFLFDYSLNLMTLLAMSLVIGILVDDSIVVLENIYRHLEMGKDKVQASLDGRNEIGFAALSITLVDVVVFLPMALVPGLVGSLVKQFSLVIVVSTLSSLVVSFTLTPMISSRFAQLTHLKKGKFFDNILLFFEHQFENLTQAYEGILLWSLKHKWATIAIAMLLLFGSIALAGFGFIGSEFAPSTDKGEMSLFVSMPQGTSIEKTDEIVKNIENQIKTIPEVTKTFTSVGYQNDGFNDNFAPNLAAVSISLLPLNQRTKSINQLAREVKTLAMQNAGIKARVSPVGLFGAQDAPIQILISNNDRDSVLKAARILLEKLKKVDGILSPRLSSEQGKPEVEIIIDRNKVAEFGLDIASVGMALRAAINGDEEMKIKVGNSNISTRIQLQLFNRNNTNKLLNLSFMNEKGLHIYLHQFAQIKLVSSPSTLERRNKVPSTIMLSQVTGRAVGDVGEDIKTAFSKSQIPANTRISYEGDLELQDDGFDKLGLALLASVILIYLIMVVLYNNWVYPFVVLFSIPLAIVGALLALALTAKTINVFSIFGLIMMMGLVAKNAILLVDRANENLAEGKSVGESLVEAGRTRLRPIVMTTLAMVIGMLPLALAKGAGSEINSGLAWVLIGGLSSSMFLTLVIVPVMYDSLTWLKRRFSQKAKLSEQVPAHVVIIGVFAAVFSLSAQAQKDTSAVSWTVNEAVDYGLAHNYQLQVANLEIEKSASRRKEAFGNFLPTVAISGNYIRNINPPVFFFPTFGQDPITGAIQIDEKRLAPINAALKNTYLAGVNANLPLIAASNFAGFKVAKASEDISKADLEVQKQNLKYSIIKSYYGILLAIESRKLIEQSIARAQEALRETKNLYARGLAIDADTLTAFVALRNLYPAQSKIETAIENGKIIFKSLLGMPDEENFALSESLLAFDIATPDAKSLSLKELVAQRKDMRVLLTQKAAARAIYSLEKNKYLPTLDLIANYQIQSQSDQFNFSLQPWIRSNYIGLQLNFPIFNGFRFAEKVSQAKISMRQLESQTKLAESQALAEIKTTQNSLKSSLFRVNETQTTIKDAERSVRLKKSRLEKGLIKLGEFQEANLALSRAENNYLQSLYDYLLAKCDAEKAQGQ